MARRTLALIVVLGCACTSTKVPAAGDVDSYVLAAACERAIQEHLPFENPSVLWFRYSPGHRSNERLEHAVSFILEHTDSRHDKSEEAYELRTVVRVAPESMLQQLGKVFSAEPDLPMELAVRRVHSERYDLLERSCPAIRIAYERFTAAASGAMKPSRDGGGFHHGPTYRVEGLAADGLVSLTVYATNPVFAWASESYDAIRACTSA